jgi:hypothetical protein
MKKTPRTASYACKFRKRPDHARERTPKAFESLTSFSLELHAHHFMGLLDGLEKLITEHGSAAILRERIAAFRDDIARLEQRNAQLETENGELRKQVSDLSQRVSQPDKEPLTPLRALSAKEKLVLIHLTREDSGLTIDELAHAIGSIPAMARHNCEELEALGLVEQIRFHGMHRRIEGADWGYALTQDGRKWMAHQTV